MPDRIVLVVYDRFEILDMAGPASVFSAANRLSDEPLYDVRACSIGGGARMSLSGISVETSDLSAMVARASDTVLVTGARPADLEALAVDAALHAWLRGAAGAAKRYGSVCTGTIALAAAGLLVDADVTTHWDACDRLAALEPTCRIDRDTIYVAQDRLWTSAGVTTGIDMALAMVGADHGPGLAARVAQRLVMSGFRTPEHRQRDSGLERQIRFNKDFRNVLGWLDANLAEPITVAQMADRTGLSERTFYRKFTAAMGLSPSKFLGRRRVERARELIQSGLLVKTAAETVGYRSEAAFRTAYTAHFGRVPSETH